MRRHGDLFDEPERYDGPEVLFFQDGPFSDYSFKHGYHYGRLAEGSCAGMWVRLGASPAAMGLIRD